MRRKEQVNAVIAKILSALERLGIDHYLIEETEKESLECFFVRKKLDLKRKSVTDELEVTVYRDFEKDGKKMRGSSAAQIYPGMEEEEVLAALQGACQAASLVCNPYYELPSGKKEAPVPSRSPLAEIGLEESMKRMTEALFAEDTEEEVFLNSAEIFLRHSHRHLVNSAGVDVAYEVYDVWGEYVVQCVAPQDVETYHQFNYRDLNTDGLRREVKEALALTRDRAAARKAPKTGEYTLLLSGQQMRTLFDFYLSRSNTSMVYQKYSNYEAGMKVQGEDIRGDALTLELKAVDPYSAEGIPMKDRLLIDEGTLQLLQGGGARFAYYLGVEPTGGYRKIKVREGKLPFEEMKKEPYLHVVSFSDFQMDDFTGHFGGEIRLAYLYDGQTVTPVTGGSLNGNIMELQADMVFSSEKYEDANYEGPYAVRFKGVKVAGEA